MKSSRDKPKTSGTTFPFTPAQKQFQLPAIASLGSGLPGQSDAAASSPAQKQGNKPGAPRSRMKGGGLTTSYAPLPGAHQPPAARAKQGVLKSPVHTPHKHLTPLANNPMSPELDLALPGAPRQRGPLGGGDSPQRTSRDEVKPLLPVKVAAGRTGAQVRGGVKLPSRPVVGSKGQTPRALVSLSTQNEKEPTTKQNKDTPKYSGNTYERLLTGCLNNLPPQRSSEVRIFLSSTFSDFKAERDALVKDAFPALKAFCADLELDFHMVDLRWGINEEATNDHTVEGLCLAEIEHCRRLSQGPHFLVLLGNRYGYRPIRPQIEMQEFEALRAIAEEKKLEGRDLLDAWYMRDDNAVPPVYMLQPINSKLPHFTDFSAENESKRLADCGKWTAASQSLHRILLTSAEEAVTRGLITQQQKHKYCSSVTEQEVHAGMLAADAANTSALCVLRELDGILSSDFSDKQTVRFIDTTTNEESGQVQVNQAISDLMAQLTQRTIPQSLAKENLKTFTVGWKPGAINPNVHADHRDYLDVMVKWCIDNIQRRVKEDKTQRDTDILKECTFAVNFGGGDQSKGQGQTPKGKGRGGSLKPKDGKALERPFGHLASNKDFMLGYMSVQDVLNDHLKLDEKKASMHSTVDKSRLMLHADILHHLHFCKSRCELFCGREAELEVIRTYLNVDHQGAPFIVHAASGSGKTAFLAMVARNTKQWFGSSCVTMVRFLGTSSQSSTLRKVLGSLCHQICLAYGLPLRHRELVKLGKLQRYFQELLMYVSLRPGAARPLMILLDSVDQLLDRDGAHRLLWLPRSIPAGVRLILSVIPDERNLLQNAKMQFGEDPQNFLELQKLPSTVVNEYIDAYMAHSKRKLTAQQRTALQGKLAADALPLLMKLALDEAAEWRSYLPVDDVVIAKTIKEAIGNLFQRLEVKYGVLFTSAALGYITVSKEGISENELEDALSCNDHVLSHVYKYHNPPVEGIVRIPPLLWARTRTDLSRYVVERQTQKKTVVFWYHRQFTECARERYASGPAALQLHSHLADIYAAENPIKRTIVLEQRKLTIEDADRQVSLQPLEARNTRKLTMLLHHLKLARDANRLKSIALLNLTFLQCYIQAFCLGDLLSELVDVLDVLDDPEIKLLYSCLRFSSLQLKEDKSGLCTQILGQLLKYRLEHAHIDALCEQARVTLQSSGKSCLIPQLGSMPSSSSMLKWYTLGPSQILAASKSRGRVLLKVDSGDQSCGTYRVLNTETLEQAPALQKASLKAEDLPVQCLMSSDGALVYLLFKEFVQVYKAQNGVRVGRFSTDVNHGGVLSLHVSVSEDGQYLVLAGPDRLAILQNQSSASDEVDFKVRRAMNFTGSVDTTNLVFSHDGEMTLSTHSIASQQRNIGAVALWKFWDKDLKTKVPLPAPIPGGFLYKLQPLAGHDIVVCGCLNGQIFIIDMEIGKVIQELGQVKPVPKSPLMFSFDPAHNFLVTGVRGQSSLDVWNVDISTAKLMASITTTTPAVKLHLSHSTQHIFAANSTGSMEIFNGETGTLLKSHNAHEQAVLSMLTDDRDQLFTTGGEGTFKLWDVEGLLSNEEGDKVRDNGAGRSDGMEATLEEEEVLCYAAAMTDEGYKIFTGSTTGLRVWAEIELQYKLLSTLIEACPVTKVCIGYVTKLAIAMMTGGLAIFDWKTEERVSVPEFDADAALEFVLVRDDLLNVLEKSENGGILLICISLADRKVLKRTTVPGGGLSSSLRMQEYLGNGEHLVALMKKGKKDVAVDVDINSSSTITCKCNSVKSYLGDTEEIHVFSVAKLADDSVLLGCHGDAFLWQPPDEFCSLVKKDEMRTWLRHSLRLYNKIQKGDDIDKVPITAIAVATNRKLIVTGCDNGSLVIWKNVPKTAAPNEDHGALLLGHRGRVTTIDISSSNQMVVTGSHDRTIRLWDVATKVQLSLVNVHMPVEEVTILPSQTTVLARGQDMDLARLFIMCINERGKFFVTE